MPEFEITFTLEKTFNVEAKNQSEAQEKGAEILAEYMELNESAMKLVRTVSNPLHFRA